MKQTEGDTVPFSPCKECEEALISILCTGDEPSYLQLQLLYFNIQK